MKNINGFSLIELLVVVAIIGVLAAVGVVAFSGFLGNSKIAASKSNHQQVVKFITTSITKCDTGGQLILKQNSTRNTSDLCSYVRSGNIPALQSAFGNHFNTLGWCNPHGLKHTSGTCQEAVANGGSLGNGRVGETQIIGNSSKKIFYVDTKVDDNTVLTNSINVIN